LTFWEIKLYKSLFSSGQQQQRVQLTPYLLRAELGPELSVVKCENETEIFHNLQNPIFDPDLSAKRCKRGGVLLHKLNFRGELV